MGIFNDLTAPSKSQRDSSIATGYPRWRARFDTFDAVALRRDLRNMRRQPLISVLLPVYNPDLRLLAAAIDLRWKRSFPGNGLSMRSKSSRRRC